MKKLFPILFLLTLSISTANAAIFQSTSSDNSRGYGVPMCFTNKKLCVVGDYIIRANGNEELYIKNGIVCNATKTQCTNGSYLMTSSTPLFEDEKEE